MTRTPEATFTPTGGLDRVAQAQAALTLLQNYVTMRQRQEPTVNAVHSDDILHTEP